MLWLALTLAVSTAQPGPVAYTDASPTSRELYSGPPVRPYEPEWRTLPAEGDTYSPSRPAVTRPIGLDAYHGAYEVTPSDAEVVYQQGVTSAALRANALMGPLDGRWRVTGPDGSPVLELLLMDRGDGALVEGAWREPQAPDAAMTSRRLGALSLVMRANETLTIETDAPDGAARLSLERDGARWRGTLERGGTTIPVVMESIG